ncbi:MAG: hypothetical protein L6367_06785 [Cellulomonas sp.]|jgi:hypothetical protein|nr:hypothetical protein [Cellulomonas sp.]
MSDDDALDFIKQIASCSGPVTGSVMALAVCEHCGGAHAVAVAHWTEGEAPRTLGLCPVAGLLLTEAV